MNHSVENEQFVINMPESISGKNSSEIEQELSAVLAGNEGYPVVLDCMNMKYISSAGLRVLLKIEQEILDGDTMTLKNVSREVYEILEMTGFVDIFHVTKKLKHMSVSGKERIVTGVNGDLYRIGHDMMVKVYHAGVTMEEVEREHTLTQKALAAGIPTPISFDYVQVGEGQYGIVYEEIQGQSLADVLQKDISRLVPLSKQLGELVRRIHAMDVHMSGLPSIKERYRTWIAQMRRKNPSYDVKKLEALVESMSESHSFVHGDINLNSVFLTDDGLLFMDMGSCGYGHPIFDLQALYASLFAIELDDPGYTTRNFGLPVKKCNHFWKCFLLYYLGKDRIKDDVNCLDGIDEERLNQLLIQYYILKANLIDAL